MEIAFYALMGAFAVTSLIHLISCLLEREGLRRATKPFCTLLLMVGILILVITYPEMPYPKHAIWIALFLAVIGNLFISKVKSRPLFVAGSIFFIVAHILNTYVMATMLSYHIEWWVFLAIAGGIPLLALALFPLTRHIFGQIAYAVNLYLSLHFVNIIFAIMLLIDGKPMISTMILIGYALYLVSDILLVYAAYGKDIRRRDFYIMAFLLAGQVLIALGLANTMLLISR